MHNVACVSGLSINDYMTNMSYAYPSRAPRFVPFLIDWVRVAHLLSFDSTLFCFVCFLSVSLDFPFLIAS